MNGLQVDKGKWEDVIQSIDEFRALLADIEFQ